MSNGDNQDLCIGNYMTKKKKRTQQKLPNLNYSSVYTAEKPVNTEIEGVGVGTKRKICYSNMY